MEILYMLIIISVILVGVIACVFIWSVRSGQYDDLEGPAHRILLDDDSASQTHPETTDENEGRRHDS